jgi:hypothetical protein
VLGCLQPPVVSVGTKHADVVGYVAQDQEAAELFYRLPVLSIARSVLGCIIIREPPGLPRPVWRRDISRTE